MKRLGFRQRLLLSLALFALVPAFVLTAVWGIAAWRTLPSLTADAAWERVATSGRTATSVLDNANLTPTEREALRSHERELESSLTQARRLGFVVRQIVPAAILGALLMLLVFAVAASRVAGHLARQLSRPIQELVGWTGHIARGEALPEETQVRGAPEFGVLRDRMRSMSHELQLGRQRAVDLERSIAFRESARRVAHELKNPLTPIQFALAQLAKAPEAFAEPVKVIREETARLDRLARSFAQFGRLPDGPPSDVDAVELAHAVMRACVPATHTGSVEVGRGVGSFTARFESIHRALSNVVLNAVDATTHGGTITMHVESASLNGEPAVQFSIADSGSGIPPDRIADIWHPYVTTKPAGTGLGLAIARQAVVEHNGEVSASSEVARGTLIRIILPVVLKQGGV